MKSRHVFIRATVIATILCIASSGCAAKNAQTSMNTERMLHAAGFQVKIADTPEKLEMLKGLAQRKIVPYPKEGEMYYLYADADTCRCLYMGTADAYQRYVEFKVGQGIADDNRKAARANANATKSYDMRVWGVWGPWY